MPLVIKIFLRVQASTAHKAAVYMQIHVDRPGWRASPELMYRTYCMPILQEQKSVTQQSWEKTISRGARE